MTAVSDSDASNAAADSVVARPPFPFWLAVIQVTGSFFAAADGTPLNGAFVLTPSAPVYLPGWGVLEGSATLTVAAGAAKPVYVACTDAVSPAFTYTVTQRLDTPDASPAPVAGVSVPHTLGPAVDISQLL